MDRPGRQGRHDLTETVTRAEVEADGDEPVRPAAAPAPTRRLIAVPEQVPWTLVHGLSLAAGTVVLLVANRNQWFFGDEWNFIVNRGPRGGSIGVLEPHNEHWVTVPVLVFRVLLAFVGLRSYLPYVAVLLALHLVLAHLLWRVSRRVGAAPAIATGLAAVFVVLGAGSENLLWAFQIAFVGMVAFGWAAVLLHDHDGPFGRRDMVGWVASIAALMCSGPGLVMLGVTTLSVALRRRRLVDTVLTAAVPGLVFASWWLAIGRDASSGADAADGAVWQLPRFTWTGLVNALEAASGIPGAGAVIVLALALWCVRNVDLASGPAAPAFAGCAGAVVFYLFVGVGRVSLGVETAASTRYVYTAVALLLPAIALALSRSVATTSSARAVVVGLCGLLVVHNIGLLRDAASADMGREVPFEGVVVAAASLVADGEPLLARTLDPTYNPDLTNEALARIDRYGWLPDIDPTVAEQLTAEVQLQVALRAPSGDLGAVTLTGGDAVPAPATNDAGASCMEVDPAAAGVSVDLVGDTDGWRVRLQGPPDGRIAVRVVSGDVASPPRPLALPATGAADLVSVADGRVVRVDLPAGPPTTVCGVITP